MRTPYSEGSYSGARRQSLILHTLYPKLYLQDIDEQAMYAMSIYGSPDLEHARRVRPAMKSEPLPAAQKSDELRPNQPTPVREVLAIEDDVLDVLGNFRVEVPIYLSFGKQEAYPLRT